MECCYRVRILMLPFLYQHSSNFNTFHVKKSSFYTNFSKYKVAKKKINKGVVHARELCMEMHRLLFTVSCPCKENITVKALCALTFTRGDTVCEKRQEAQFPAWADTTA